MVEAHIGELGIAEVVMHDADGNPTDSYDTMTGISYASTNPTAVNVVDDDAEPKDARVEFLALADGVTITCTFDGDPGDGERPITLVSEEINVVPGEATGGEIKIRFTQQA
jgi:hypothetical protein